MEPVRDFTVEESFPRRDLLVEAMDIVRYAEVHMGAEGQPRADDGRKGRALELLQKLDAEQASFSPRLDVRRLTLKDFGDRGVEPPAALRGQLRDNHFYRVGIPVTLFPRSGWAFTRLECWVGFCPDEADARLRPVVHDLFPEDVWQEVLRLQGGLSVGLDEELRFRAEVPDLAGAWGQLSGEARARLAVRAEGGAGLVVGPLGYRLRRAQVRARGRGNAESFWRLDGKEYVDQEDVLLGVVLRVPRTRPGPVRAAGELKAYHDFQPWTADLFKDWRHYFGQALKSLFGAGVVLRDTRAWEDITAGGG